LEKLTKKALKEQYKERVVVGGVYCIKCNDMDQSWMRATTDMKGSKNRFLFSVSANSTPELCMTEAWNRFGPSAFSFEIVEELKKKEAQTEREFSDDVKTLLELWLEKKNGEQKEE